QRERAQETTAENLSTARTAAEGAEKVRAAHEAGAAADAARSETLILYKSKRAAYASLAVPVQALEAAQTALDIAEQARDSAQKTAEQKRDAVKEAYDALTDGEAILSDARARYMAGICGELAGTLHDGEACPVCGSPTHPHPAQRDLESVSRAQLDVLEQAAQAARESWSTADRARETAETALRGKDAQYHAAKAEAERARHALETAQAALIPGIADAEALEAAITELETAQSRYQNRLNLLTEQAQQAAEQLARREEQFQTAAGELAAAAETQREAERLCLAALEAHGFPDVEAARAALLPQETRNTLRDEIGRYETLLEENTRAVTEAQAALAGKEEPDREAVKDKLDAVEAEMLAYRERHTTLSDRAAHLTERLKTVGEKQRRYDAERGQVESDYAFARSLRGDTGVGLQRYVLGVMFSSVIGAANRMLEHVHGGRYRLYRSDARGEGNKRGLELYIHDNRAPEDAGRSVGTLSGGEKFLVSLALSIGLSSVAQRSGIRLGTLFIDEGFGSLDDQSIDDALSVIGSIQRASGTVGIISHVGILYDTLSAKVEVSKSDTGSHIVQAVG
ncbi:MAG: SMC family ATPase, partial [Oscillospiraceae bacterium]|nr:SMC family ATPase [Oscillospiraceae bacterium]